MTLQLPAVDEVHVWVVPCAERDPAARRSAGRQALVEIVRAYAPDTRVAFRPARRARVDGSPLRVSLARGGGFALVAVATGRDVGVDVEPVRPAPPAAVVEHLLTALEAHALDRLDGGVRDAAFARAWVRKEAALKAVGVGLAVEPCLVEVGVAHTGSPLVAVPEHGEVMVRDLRVDGNVAAVAARGAAPFAVRRRDWVSSGRAEARTPARAAPALQP